MFLATTIFFTNVTEDCTGTMSPLVNANTPYFLIFWLLVTFGGNILKYLRSVRLNEFVCFISWFGC